MEYFSQILTHLGHFLTRVLLRHDFDATGGFRVYRLDKISKSTFDTVSARDYEFFILVDNFAFKRSFHYGPIELRVAFMDNRKCKYAIW